MALNFPVSTETSGYSATHRKMVARNPDWLVLRNLSVFVQEALLALRQIDGAHAYLPGEGSVLGMRAGNYIDSAGTLAGVLDSPVGRVEDVFGGIHASQNTTADKPKLTRRVNLLSKTESTNQAPWIFYNPSGTATQNGNEYVFGASEIDRIIQFNVSIVEGVTYRVALLLSGSGVIRVVFIHGSGASELVQTLTLTATPTIYFVDVLCNATGSGGVGIYNNANGTAGAAFRIHNASLTTAADAYLPYQKVNTATSYDTLGFPARWDFDTTDRLALTLPAGYESATVIDATSAGPVTLLEQDVTGAYGIVGGLTDVPELVTNGDFSNGTTNWSELSSGSSTFSVTNGEMFITPTATTYSGTPVEIYQNINTVIGSTYIATGLYRATGTGTIYVRIAMATENATNVTSVTANPQFGEIRFVATAAVTKIRLLVYGTSSMTGLFKSISVREILASTHGRIILRDTPTPRQLELCQGLASRLANVVPNPWTPALLFAAGEQGAWYDPSDFSTLYQDAAGTVPVTDVGQPVGKILDKSGRGHHATQTTATKRPLLQRDGFARYHLRFDGVDDFLSTEPFATPIAQPNSYYIGRTWDSLAATRHIFDGDSVNRQLFVGDVGSEFFRASNGEIATPPPVVGAPAVISLRANGSLSFIRKNGVQTNGNAGLSSMGRLYLGANYVPNNYGNFRLYTFILVGAANSEAQIASAERYVNSKTGAY
jgi:hypothetical protein